MSATGELFATTGDESAMKRYAILLAGLNALFTVDDDGEYPTGFKPEVVVLYKLGRLGLVLAGLTNSPTSEEGPYVGIVAQRNNSTAPTPLPSDYYFAATQAMTPRALIGTSGECNWVHQLPTLNSDGPEQGTDGLVLDVLRHTIFRPDLSGLFAKALGDDATVSHTDAEAKWLSGQGSEGDFS